MSNFIRQQFSVWANYNKKLSKKNWEACKEQLGQQLGEEYIVSSSSERSVSFFSSNSYIWIMFSQDACLIVYPITKPGNNRVAKDQEIITGTNLFLNKILNLESAPTTFASTIISAKGIFFPTDSESATETEAATKNLLEKLAGREIGDLLDAEVRLTLDGKEIQYSAVVSANDDLYALKLQIERRITGDPGNDQISSIVEHTDVLTILDEEYERLKIK